MWEHQLGVATSIEANGQSGQYKLHTFGEHLKHHPAEPGGPTTAEPDDWDGRQARACSCSRRSGR